MVSKEDNIINSKDLYDRIYTIRNQKVMLDFELAEIYGYETKRFNEQVKNNIEKFDSDFRFQLTDIEWENLRSKKSTSSWGGRRYNPHAFTEQGIYMLMTVLKGELATKQSKALIRTFKQMKDYILDNKDLIDQRQLIALSIDKSNNDKEIKNLQKSLNKVDEKVAGVIDSLSDVVHKSDLSDLIFDFSKVELPKEFLILDGEITEASLAYKDIYALAEKSIYIIDNYIGLKTLILLKDVDPNIEVTIYSDNLGLGLHQIEYQDFINQFPSLNIDFKISNSKFHDRYIFIDWESENKQIYHCGASSKDAGNRITTISKIDDTFLYENIIKTMINNPTLVLR